LRFHQRRKHLAHAIAVAKLQKILVLAEPEHVRSAAGWIEAAVAFRAVALAELATDAAVRVLLAVEVVERVLELEGAVAVAPEQRDENGVPHVQAVVEHGGREIRNEAVVFGRTPKVLERDLPAAPVTLDGGLMTAPMGYR
jgi:hypothetical protein